MGAQIKKEISIMKSVAHNHVVAIRDVFATSSKIFIVLELVDGGELFEYLLEKKRLAEAEARHFLQQIVDGLGYCHSQGIFHRDLKPENLLLDLNGDIKISDFGLSTLYVGGADGGASDDRVELLHTTCGTPNYVAPEVLENRGYDGRQADVWSVGIVLFVLVAGYLPFEEDTMPTLFEKIKRAEFSMPDCSDGNASPQRAKNPYARGNRGTPSASPAKAVPRPSSSVLFSRDLIDLLSHVLVADPQMRWTLEQVKTCKWMQGLAERPEYIQNRAEAAATPDRKSMSNKAEAVMAPLSNDENAAPNLSSSKQAVSRPPKVNSSNPLHGRECANTTTETDPVLPPLPPDLRMHSQLAVEVQGISMRNQSSQQDCSIIFPSPPLNIPQHCDLIASKRTEDQEEEKQLLSTVPVAHACCSIQ